MSRSGPKLAFAAALLLGAAASAQERWDHRGAVGLLLSGGAEIETSFAGLTSDATTGAVTDLGTTVAVGNDGNEILVLARLGFGAPDLDVGLIAGYRGYFGAERWKTFVDLGGALHVRPDLAVGPRVGFGVQYELAPVAGLFVGAAAQFAVGGGLRVSTELVAGLQLRTYLLE